jgi:hypothetical protein
MGATINCRMIIFPAMPAAVRCSGFSRALDGHRVSGADVRCTAKWCCAFGLLHPGGGEKIQR